MYLMTVRKAKFCMVLLFLNLAEYIANAENNRVSSKENELDWWKTAIFYQVYPKSFKDNDDDGEGDLKGIEKKAEHFKDLGIDCIWLQPIFKSPMADFGYDISDYNKIDNTFGTMDDFISLEKKLTSLGIKIILDFVPNHSSDEHEWFEKSIKRIDPYTDYYVWRDAKISVNGLRQPPNNWQSQFSRSAWTWNEKRGQYYLHQFDPKQPDLNYRNPNLVEEMKDNLRFWLDRGVDGYAIVAVSVLFEDKNFLDEPRKPEELASKEKNTYDQYYHKYTRNLPETFDMIAQFGDVLDEYTRKDGKTRIMITEACTSIKDTMMYYGNETNPGAHFPFNFVLINDLNDQSNATNFNNAIHSWLDNMPSGKQANWVVGNHDESRVATRFGKEMVDAMNMLNLLLPGAAFTYMGEEIGMEDTNIRWDQTVDHRGLNAGIDGYRAFSRDPERSPYQWDDTKSAGFSSTSKTWLPVNPNYWELNLDKQKGQRLSHYTVYKRLAQLKKTKTMKNGSFDGYVVSEWVYAFIRSLPESETYLIVMNVGSEDELVNLSSLLKTKRQSWFVHTSSINSQYCIGDPVTMSNITMRPKSALVLSQNIYNSNDQMAVNSSPCSNVLSSVMTLFVFGCILANRYGNLNVLRG